MWLALSIAPSVSSIPLHGSFSISAMPVSATQTSPPWCAGSKPGAKRFLSSGYIQAGDVVAVPYESAAAEEEESM
jgi:hypothetical protein